MQLIVLGVHRSGTSVVSRLLNMMGAYFAPEGKEMKAQSDNPKGFWERQDVVDINDEILASNQYSWDNPPLGLQSLEVDSSLNKRMEEIVMAMDGHRPWFLKDPRMCLTFEAWAPKLEVPVCIYVTRDPLEIARSLERRNALPIPVGLALWDIYNTHALNACKNVPHIIVHHQDLVSNPVATMTAMYDDLLKLGVDALRKPKDNEITAFFDRSLIHHKAKSNEYKEFVPAEKSALYRHLSNAKTIKKDVSYTISPISSYISSSHFSEKALHLERSNRIAFLEDNLALTKIDAERLTAEKNNLQLENKNLTSEKKGLISERESLTSEKKDLISERESLTSEKKDLISEREGLVSEKKDLISEREGLVSENKDLISEREGLVSEKKDLISEREGLVSEKKDLISEREGLVSEKKDLISERESLVSENKSLASKEGLLSEANANFQSAISQLDIENTKSKDKIDDLCREAENQQSTQRKLEADIIQANNYLSEEKDRSDLFNSWLTEILKTYELMQSSVSYKLASIVTFLFKILTLRWFSKSAEHHLRRIIGEYKNWKAGNECQKEKINKGAGKVRLFFSLIKLFLLHPFSSLKQLRWHRIKSAISVFSSFSQNETLSIVHNFHQKVKCEDGVEDLVLTVSADFPETAIREIRFPDTKTPLVSIVIPVYNKLSTTLNCLQSICQHTNGIEYEVIIADDCSQDDTAHLGSQIENIRINRNEENLGFLLNCNNAAKCAKGKYVLFLNNDTLVQPEWLDHLVAAAERDPSIGLIGPKLLFENGKLQEAGGIIWSDASGWNFGRNDDPNKPEYNYLKEADYISGAGIMIPRHLWEKIGGFDTYLTPAYYEDTDLAFEVRRRGYKVIYQPLSRIVHVEGVSHGTDTDSGIKRYQTINHDKFYNKWKSTLQTQQKENGVDVFTAKDRSNNKECILVIDHYVPHFDQDAGSKSTYMYLKLMVAQGYNVKFLGDNFYKHEPYTTELQQLGIEVLYGNWYANNWEAWLSDNCQYIDYIYLHRPHIAEKYVGAISKLNHKPKLIYFGHDLHFLRTQRQYEITKTKALLPQVEEWKQRELKIFSHADVVYYPSQAEIDVIKKISPETNAKAIPLYIFDKITNKPAAFNEREHIFFVGGFNHPPNEDAVIWFIEEIFPLILKEIPEIKFIIAGSKISEKIESFQSKNIVVAGRVSEEELDNLYQSCKLSVVPLRFGAGIKGKILEAAYHQLPVVTTSVGAEGLPEPDRFLRISDRPEDFARSVVDLYNNETQWSILSEKCKDVIEQNFSDSSALKVITDDFSKNDQRMPALNIIEEA